MKKLAQRITSCFATRCALDNKISWYSFGCRFEEEGFHMRFSYQNICFENIVEKCTASAASQEFACKFLVNVQFGFVEEV